MVEISTARQPGKALKALLLFSAVPNVLAFGVISPTIASISAELGTDPGKAYMIKMLIGIIGPASIVGSPLAGYLADKFDRRPLWLSFAALFVVSGLVPGLLTDVPAMLACRFVTGLSAAALATLGMALVGECIAEAARPKWMGWLQACGIFTAIFLMPLSGFIGDVGWRWSFLLYLLGLPVIGLVLAAHLGNTHLAVANAPRSAGSGGTVYPVGLILLGLLVGVTNLPGLFIAFYFEEIGLGRPSTVGFVLMLNAIVGAVVTALFGTARAHFAPRPLLCFSFAVMCLGIGMLVFVANLGMATAALLVMGVGTAWLSPNVMSLVVASAPESHRARAVGAVWSAFAVAPALGITALQPVIAAYGMHGILIATAGLAGLTALIVAVVPWRPLQAAAITV